MCIRDRTCIVPIIDKKFIVLLKQYRYGSDQIMLEVPAGTIDPGERPLSCAKRELIEETGYHGKNWKMIGKYFSTPAYNTCLVHCYLTHCYKKSETHFDEDEVLETKIYSVQEVRRLLKTNKINDMKTYISLDRFMNYY